VRTRTSSTLTSLAGIICRKAKEVSWFFLLREMDAGIYYCQFKT
jgi:hypothetical protein